MKENIMPSYLPAVAVTFMPKNGGEPKTVYRPFESLTMEQLAAHRKNDAHGVLLELGERYYFGWGGAEQDYAKAYEYLREAAELGVQDAQALLAGYYVREDIGLLPKDPSKCEMMLLLAAESGSWKAMETLALCYRDGKDGFPIDHEKAFYWAKEAERMLRIYWDFYAQPDFIDFEEKQKEIITEHSRMSVVLMLFCMNGVGVKRDLKEAEKWLDSGEKFVCRITGLAKVPLFQEQRAVLRARAEKDRMRAEKAAKEKIPGIRKNR